MVSIEEHPLLEAEIFRSTLPQPLGNLVSGSPPLLDSDAPSPFSAEPSVKQPVRDLLRHGGFRPSGRSKPASEYLRAAEAKGRLGPINAVVDVCNVVSLHSGLPISVVDFRKLDGALRIGVAPANSSYVFNASGQEMKLDGLLCLFDGQGPCANAVKDSQRTKTDDETTEVLTVIWGTTALPGRAAAARDWYQALLGGVLTST